MLAICKVVTKSLDCQACPLKPKCCPNMPARKIPRDVQEEARDKARSLAGTPAFEQSRNERKKVEMLFRAGGCRTRGRGCRDDQQGSVMEAR